MIPPRSRHQHQAHASSDIGVAGQRKERLEDTCHRSHTDSAPDRTRNHMHMNTEL